MRRRREGFVFSTSEHTQRDHFNLCVTVLSRFTRAHIDNLTGVSFDHNVSTLSQGARLNRVPERGTGIGTSMLLINTGISQLVGLSVGLLLLGGGASGTLLLGFELKLAEFFDADCSVAEKPAEQSLFALFFF